MVQISNRASYPVNYRIGGDAVDDDEVSSMKKIGVTVEVGAFFGAVFARSTDARERFIANIDFLHNFYKFKFYLTTRFAGGEGLVRFICAACPESGLIINRDSSTASNAEPVTRPSS